LTDRIEAQVHEYLERIDRMGGAVAAIERGYPQREIQNAAFEYQQRVETGQQVIVGVNRYRMQDGEQKGASVPGFRLDPRIEQTQVERLRELRAGRSATAVEDRLLRLRETARGSDNLMPAILAAAENYETVGEISAAMRSIFGEYTEGT